MERLEGILQGIALYRRQRALEAALDGMAARVARAEIALLRQQCETRRQTARAEAAEAALVRLQDMLDQLRQDSRRVQQQG